MSKPFILVGKVGYDFEVKSAIDYIGTVGGDYDSANVTHEKLRWSDGYNWRYNSTTNTLCWWPGEYREMSEDHKEAVLFYLREKYNVTNPNQTASKESYFNDGHYINANRFGNVKENVANNKYYRQIMERCKLIQSV
jgi:hypothetical protein